VNGNQELVKKYNCNIFSYSEKKFGDDNIEVIKTPGHTKDHVCFYFPDSHIIFTADTLFSLGCGRMFDGTLEEYFASLQKIKMLPDDTLIYCGHEYTLENGEFCLSVDADNQALQDRMSDIRKLRADNKPTIPTTLKKEKATNIFLKAQTVEEFSRYRKLKDNF
jgi:hydroxyacylglutathione hydrolase